MSHETGEHFQVTEDRGVAVVTVNSPQIDPEAKEELYAVAARVSAGAVPKEVVLSLRGVRQIQSQAIGILINFQKRVRDAGGALKVADAEKTLMDVFHLTKMTQVIDFCATRQDAVDAFHGKGRAKGGVSGGEGGSWFSKIFGAK
jgi:anti-anti-sigma factor